MSVLLVTGGGGFVMSHLVLDWVARGPDHRVIVMDCAPLDAPAQAFLAGAGERLAIVPGDVGDADMWTMLGYHPWSRAISHVVHGAAVTSIDRLRLAGGLAGVTPALATNLMGVAHALAFAETLPGLQRLIFVSSGAVYASHGRQAPGQPLPEDGSVAPEGYYAVSKLVGELLTAQAATDQGLPALSVRLSGVYGPLDRATPSRAVDCAPKQMLHLARDAKTVRISGGGAMGDFIHSGDVARGLGALLTCARPRHPVYNIALGEFVSLLDLARLAARIIPGFSFEEVEAGDADLAGNPAHVGGRWGAYDISRMAADTGWRPRPLETALADYAAWLRKNPW